METQPTTETAQRGRPAKEKKLTPDQRVQGGEKRVTVRPRVNLGYVHEFGIEMFTNEEYVVSRDIIMHYEQLAAANRREPVFDIVLDEHDSEPSIADVRKTGQLAAKERENTQAQRSRR